jgi:phenylalanyl-tRNA synthetase beta chain
VRYDTTGFDDRKHAFRPLVPPGQAETGRWTEAWTPAEILRDHPTGREYKDALEGAARAPILLDAKGEVLSFPPIINSRTLGRVVVGMDRLFVEVTGRNLDQVLLAANILAANMHDRGARVVPVRTNYGYDTARGRQVRSPNPLATKRMVEVAIDVYRKMLGEPKLGFEEVRKFLELYGLEAEGVSESIRIEAPPYRMDYLHEVDAVEDFAMSRGYGSFQALMPEEFTVGRLSEATELEDAARDRMIGFGFEEAICNILTATELVRDKMDGTGGKLARGLAPFHGGELVRIANVMNASYGVLRDWVLPSLLEVESHSASAAYPHRVFEAGEVTVLDKETPSGSRTERRIGALVAHEDASFSEAQAYLHVLLKYLGIEPEIAGRSGATTYKLEPIEHPTFIPGRAALARIGGRPLGFLGEVHPGVLEAWGIRVPAAGFEISLAALTAEG